MKKSIAILLLLLLTFPLFSQKELYVSQYMHNRYAVNSAFGGSAEALSVFGAYRKQWAGLNGSPAAQFFSAHTPLKNERIALGIELFSQQYAVSHSNGFAASYTYRIRPTAHTRLGLGLNAGMSFNTAGWNEVSVKNSNDPVFEASENKMLPVVGFGAAWYGDRFFAGVSVPNFFKQNWVNMDESEFSIGDAHYLITGGYLFQLSKVWALQPSSMVRVASNDEAFAEGGMNMIFQNVLWLGGSYRTTKDVVLMLGYQVIPQMCVVYSWDKTSGQIGGMSSGSHEISLRYEFGVKIPAVNPRFF